MSEHDRETNDEPYEITELEADAASHRPYLGPWEEILAEAPLPGGADARHLLATIIQMRMRLDQASFDLMAHYAVAGRDDEVRRFARLAIKDMGEPGHVARFVLGAGCAMEDAERFDLAAEFYAQGVRLEPLTRDVWYFLNNNLAYSLSRLGRHAEAERAARRALHADPGRHNAHKNLGIALHAQGRVEEAVDAYGRAVEICPRDRRAFDLLDGLVREHGDRLAAARPDARAMVRRLGRLVRDAARRRA